MANLREEYLNLRCHELEQEVRRDCHQNAVGGWIDYWQFNADFEDTRDLRGIARQKVMRQVAHALANQSTAPLLIAIERLKWALDAGDYELRKWGLSISDPDSDSDSSQTDKSYQIKPLF